MGKLVDLTNEDGEYTAAIQWILIQDGVSGGVSVWNHQVEASSLTVGL